MWLAVESFLYDIYSWHIIMISFKSNKVFVYLIFLCFCSICIAWYSWWLGGPLPTNLELDIQSYAAALQMNILTEVELDFQVLYYENWIFRCRIMKCTFLSPNSYLHNIKPDIDFQYWWITYWFDSSALCENLNIDRPNLLFLWSKNLLRFLIKKIAFDFGFWQWPKKCQFW